MINIKINADESFFNYIEELKNLYINSDRGVDTKDILSGYEMRDIDALFLSLHKYVNDINTYFSEYMENNSDYPLGKVVEKLQTDIMTFEDWEKYLKEELNIIIDEYVNEDGKAGIKRSYEKYANFIDKMLKIKNAYKEKIEKSKNEIIHIFVREGALQMEENL